ncbi:hypothetical protein N7548_00600 [Acholeplasma manati]|uniref:Uncharacterized protein n=1 Tax=Paracholeplasma manati TaxID=591373 RepID=A0ABT2Y3K7_9MOLU|nr:hypothetical protein [Paracholeplasma manati]MCV2231325.1 hypothetical protein [Paracholeplasma manati]
MKQSTVILRVLSIIYFPLFLFFGTVLVERMISNRQKITSHDNIYEVKEPGTLQMEYESKISFDIDVKAEVLPLPGANIFYLLGLHIYIRKVRLLLFDPPTIICDFYIIS